MTSTTHEHVLRIPCIDKTADFVLVNVSKNGRNPLDLKIEATEGENPYMTTSEHVVFPIINGRRQPLISRVQ